MQSSPLRILPSLLLLALCAGCGNNILTLREADAGRTVDVKNGEEFAVMLQGNPTTGFEWLVNETDSTIVRQEGNREFHPYSSGDGSGGDVTLRFRAIAPGKTPLRLVYRRPWESVPPIERYEVSIVVR